MSRTVRITARVLLLAVMSASVSGGDLLDSKDVLRVPFLLNGIPDVDAGCNAPRSAPARFEYLAKPPFDGRALATSALAVHAQKCDDTSGATRYAVPDEPPGRGDRRNQFDALVYQISAGEGELNRYLDYLVATPSGDIKYAQCGETRIGRFVYLLPNRDVILSVGYADRVELIPMEKGSHYVGVETLGGSVSGLLCVFGSRLPRDDATNRGNAGTPAKESDSGGLNTSEVIGALVGALGAIVGIVVVITGAYFWHRRRLAERVERSRDEDSI